MTHDMNMIGALREEYDAIPIPAELDFAIEKGLSEGRALKRSRQWGKAFKGMAAAVILTVGVLTTAVNVSPAFAEAMESIPVIGRLVEVLRFTDGKASGGAITDGSDISEIVVAPNGEAQELFIHFTQTGTAQAVSAAYTMTYTESPSVMQIDVGGVRMMSAREDFQTIRELDLVEDVYTLMTLDDSLVRFQIVFKSPVSYEVEEYADPAGIRLIVRELVKEQPDAVYSVRTVSIPLSESFGHMEEMLMNSGDPRISGAYRILKDASGDFLFEFGQFETKEAAENLFKELRGLVPLDMRLEQREPDSLPERLEP